MKKNPISKIIVLSFLFLLFSAKSYSQYSCSYGINNTKDCQVTVTVDFYDNSGLLCKSVPLTVAPGTIQYANCSPGCTGVISDVKVTLTSSSSSGAGLPIAVSFGGSQYAQSNSTAPCPTAGGSTSSKLFWFGNQTVVGP